MMMKTCVRVNHKVIHARAGERADICSEQEHKGEYSLYFSIYSPSPLGGMYHSALT